LLSLHSRLSDHALSQNGTRKKSQPPAKGSYSHSHLSPGRTSYNDPASPWWPSRVLLVLSSVFHTRPRDSLRFNYLHIQSLDARS
jgi:hypothetical protein